MGDEDLASARQVQGLSLARQEVLGTDGGDANVQRERHQLDTEKRVKCLFQVTCILPQLKRIKATSGRKGQVDTVRPPEEHFHKHKHKQHTVTLRFGKRTASTAFHDSSSLMRLMDAPKGASQPECDPIKIDRSGWRQTATGPLSPRLPTHPRAPHKPATAPQSAH